MSKIDKAIEAALALADARLQERGLSPADHHMRGFAKLAIAAYEVAMAKDAAALSDGLKKANAFAMSQWPGGPIPSDLAKDRIDL